MFLWWVMTNRTNSFISPISTKMEFMNKANLWAAASSNLEQQIMKSDIDKRDKGHRACPSKPDLNITSRARYSSWIYGIYRTCWKEFAELHKQYSVLTSHGMADSSPHSLYRNVSIFFFSFLCKGPVKNPQVREKKQYCKWDQYKGFIFDSWNPRYQNWGRPKVRHDLFKYHPWWRNTLRAEGLLQTLHFYLILYKLILW